MKNIAILLATYNGGQYLRQQLDSLFAQTNHDFRIVIHDDGSTDDTIDIINEYRDRFPDRVELLYGNPKGSPMANFMYMLSEVEADYYFLCDQDDVWLPDKVQESLNALQVLLSEAKSAQPLPAIVFTDMYVVDKDLKIIDNSFIRYLGRDRNNIAYTQILIDNPAAGTTMCFNRSLRDIAISCDSVQWENVPMHDAWILEIAAIFGRVASIDKPLVYYRQTGSNTMGAVTESTRQKVARNTSDMGGGFFAKKKAFIAEARGFAREILRLRDIPEDKLKVLNDFVHIGSKPKLARINFYKKNNFTRAHNNIWMRLWV